MATIVTRRGADGLSFQARIRLARDGKLVHKESRTFLTRTAAKDLGEQA
jgi:hypothetical protein